MLLKNIPIASLGLAGLFSFGQAASFSQNCKNLILEYPNFWEDEFILSIFEENFSEKQPLDFYELFDLYVKKFESCQNTAYTETGISNFFNLNEEFSAIESEFLSLNARQVPVQTKEKFVVAASLIGNSNINLIPEGPFDGNNDEGCATGEDDDDQVDFSLNISNLKDDIFDDGENNDSESFSNNNNNDYNGEYDIADHEQALINQYKSAEEESARFAAQQKNAAEKLASQKNAEELKQNELEAEKAAKIAAELEAANKLAEEKAVAEKIAARKKEALAKFAAETAAAEKAAAEIEAKEEAERIAAVIAAAEEAERIAAEKEAAAKLAAEQEAVEAAAAAAAEEAAKLAAEEKAAARIAAEEAAKFAAQKEAAENSAKIEQSVKQASENAEQIKENSKIGFTSEEYETEIFNDIDLEIEDNEGSLGHAGFLTNDESDDSENGENSEENSNTKTDSEDEDKHVSMSIFANEDTPVGTGMVELTGFSLIVAVCVAMP